MDASKPITFADHLQLSSVGIYPASISSRRTLTVESDHYICVREKVNEQNQVVIIDLADANNVLRRLITADSAIRFMHPKDKILALNSQLHLQVFNIELRQKVKSHIFIDVYSRISVQRAGRREHTRNM